MKCHLCQRERRLVDSHMIPRFVFRWVRESSPTGYLRTSQTPNRRVQDGPTKKLLCEECETLFSQWEKEFAERIFLPIHQGAAQPLPYEEWALKFAASMSWRALIWPEHGRLDHLSEQQRAAAERAAETWRQFLLGKRDNPGIYEQRVIPLDVLETHTTPALSPFMNRYMIRTVVADVVNGKRTVFTYSKLCRVLVLGFVDVPDRRKWVGGKIRVKRGTIGGAVQYEWPSGFFDYINDSANAAGAALGSMSQRQTTRLTDFMMNDIEGVARSEVFRAMRKDVEFSGPRAFALDELKNQKTKDEDRDK
jgi:hypothetical protein